jgi:hypothetical protein
MVGTEADGANGRMIRNAGRPGFDGGSGAKTEDGQRTNRLSIESRVNGGDSCGSSEMRKPSDSMIIDQVHSIPNRISKIEV